MQWTFLHTNHRLKKAICSLSCKVVFKASYIGCHYTLPTSNHPASGIDHNIDLIRTFMKTLRKSNHKTSGSVIGAQGRIEVQKPKISHHLQVISSHKSTSSAC